jgi:CHAD domain-containing protein
MAASPKTRELLDQLTAAVRQAIHAPQPDRVHDLRVAIRRFGQGLAIASPDSVESEKTRRALKRIMRMAGGVRDFDIAMKLAARHHAPQKFLQRLKARRDAAERTLLAELHRWLDASTAARWKEALPSEGRSAIPDKVILRQVKKLFKRGSAAEDSDTELHSLRIAAKKLRYTLDLLHHGDQRHVEQIKELQRRLGDINDYETVRRIATKEAAPKRLLRSLLDKHQKKVKAFHRYWEQQFSGRKREWKRVTLQTAPAQTASPQPAPLPPRQAAPSRSRRERQGAA